MACGRKYNYLLWFPWDIHEQALKIGTISA